METRCKNSVKLRLKQKLAAKIKNVWMNISEMNICTDKEIHRLRIAGQIFVDTIHTNAR